MANAWVHSKSSAIKFGGDPNDYLEIHKKMDCSKAYFPNNAHRALTHNMFWIQEVMIPLFGYNITNSEGEEVCVKDICELHILEDFAMKYIPSAQDYLEHLDFQDWMQNGMKGYPSSYKKINEKNSKM
jgi:hypothetical protein